MIDVPSPARAARRPWFHLLWNATPERVESVRMHGLERVASNYREFWESRPGHTYLGSKRAIQNVYFKGQTPFAGRAHIPGQEPTDWALFAVDLECLDADRLNPDEDHFGLYSPTGGLDVLQRFRLQLPPCQWAWDWAKYLGIWQPPSLGEWAEAINLGADAATTRYSVTHGSLAYRGVVPPTALRLIRTTIEMENRAKAA